tara:strand:- start:1348 stop:2283 length:936 start_codon:yes stop_codon:yes gene_type:complete
MDEPIGMERPQSPTDGPVAKRPARDYDFMCRTAHPSLARTMVDMIGAVMTTSCQFSIQKDEAFTGLVVKNIDASRSCIVHAQLRCEVEFPSHVESAQFAVKVRELAAFLRVIKGHWIMELTRPRNSADVHIISRDQINLTKVNQFSLGTLSDDFDCATMQMLDYEYTVQMNLDEFRSILKLASEVEAEVLTFTVYRHTKDARTICFHLSAKGVVSQSHHYFPSKADDRGIFASDTGVMDMDQGPQQQTHLWKLVYTDQFSLKWLSKFIKSMERNDFTMRISPGLPLVVLYKLGGDDSHVCYVLAAKTPDDD